MTTLKIQKTINDSIEAGYSKDPAQVAATILQKAAKVFGDKLEEQKVKKTGQESWFVGWSMKFDTAFIFFRGHFFDVHLNIELLDAGLEGLYFVRVIDDKKIETYQQIRSRHGQNNEPVSIDYAWKKEWLN